MAIFLGSTEFLAKKICRKLSSSSSYFFLNLDFFKTVQKYCFKNYFSLLVCGDIEPNPGWHGGLKLLHWNLNSMKKDDYSRVGLVEAHLRQHNIHIAAFSESKLSKTCNYCNDDSNACDTCKKLKIKDYCLVRSDLTGHDTHGGICVYYRESLPVIRLPQPNYILDLDLPSYTICLQIKAGKKNIPHYIIHKVWAICPTSR